MRTFIKLLGCLLLCVIMSCEAQKSKLESMPITELTFEEFEEGILLDVRTKEEFNEGHLSGALNIDFLQDNFAEQVHMLNKKKTLYVYCKSGNRSAKAAKILIDEGFKHVINLEGGITAWQEIQSKVQ